MKVHYPSTTCSRAFTLLELLLAGAVILVLAGILLPTLARARGKVHATGCLNNLRQWGIATRIWLGDNEGLLPKDGTPNGRSTNEGWYIDLPRAIGIPTYHEHPWRTNRNVDPGRSIWICPANIRRSNSNNLFHYSLNQHVNGSGTGIQIPFDMIPAPVRTIWLFDNGGLAAVAGPNNVHTNLHLKGAQFLFLDGHTQRYRNTDYWDFKKGRGRRDHPELRWEPFE